MSPLGTVVFKAPRAVHEIAGRDGDHVCEEVAELRVPSKHQRHQRIYAHAQRSDERAAYNEADELAEEPTAVGVK